MRILNNIVDTPSGNFVFEKSVTMRSYSYTPKDMATRLTGEVAYRECFERSNLFLPARRRTMFQVLRRMQH